jgi:DNA-binding response OmpR family regulator
VAGADASLEQRIGVLMQRVLIVGAQPAGAKLLVDLLRSIGRCQIWTAADCADGLQAAKTIEPHLIFAENGEELDGVAFVRGLRRSHLAARKSVVILISGEATAAAIIGARDAGVHEFLKRPYTSGDLSRRLEAVARRPREWVEGIDYIGPDRRRFNVGDYAGPLRRRVDHAVTPDEARIVQAIRNIKAAVGALDRDPRQALRSIRAQAEVLACVARTRADPVFRMAVDALAGSVSRRDLETLNRSEIEGAAAPLLAFLPAERSAA